MANSNKEGERMEEHWQQNILDETNAFFSMYNVLLHSIVEP